MVEFKVPEEEIMKFKRDCPNQWRPADPRLPPGWMVSLTKHETGAFHTYLSPAGRWFGGEVKLLRHFITDSHFSEQDVDNMRDLMLDASMPYGGYVKLDHLPPKWLAKPSKSLKHINSPNRCFNCYITPEGERILNATQVIKHMKEQGLDATVIENFRLFCGIEVQNKKIVLGEVTSPKTPKRSSKAASTTEKTSSDSSSVPVTPVIKRERAGETTVLDPAVTTQPEPEPEQNENPFLVVDFLPEGWTFREARKGRKEAPGYMNLQGTILKSIKEVVTSLVKEGCSQEQVDKFKFGMKSFNFRRDPNLPDGWLVGTVYAGKDLSTMMYRFLSPDGDLFNNRATAIQFMISSDHPQADRDKMIDSLADEGYVDDEVMGPGWRKKYLTNSQPILLTPTFDTCRRKPQVLEYLIQHGATQERIQAAEDYLRMKLTPSQRRYLERASEGAANTSEDKRKHSEAFVEPNGDKFKMKREKVEDVADVSRIKQEARQTGVDGIQWVPDSSLPPSWRVAEVAGAFRLRTGSGQEFASRKEAIDFMIREQASPIDIFKVWNTLDLEGWLTDEEHLPTGWKRKWFPDLVSNLKKIKKK